MSTLLHDAPGRPSVLQLILPFWKAKSERVAAYGKLLVVLAILFGGTYLAVWANQLLGQVTDALVNRKWDVLVRALTLSVTVGVASGLLLVLDVMTRGLLELQWRTWLSEVYLKRWTSAHAYYDIEREGVLSNADQRIAEDVHHFVERTIHLSLSFTMALVHGITFGLLLWSLSGSLRFELWGQPVSIPGYMLYVSVLYTAIELALVHWVGKRLVGLNVEKQTTEADYRYLAMQLRENSEQIAFYGGGEREYSRLWGRFHLVRRNARQIIGRIAKLSVTRTVYGHVLHPLPTVAALPRYFAGELTMGGLVSLTGAYGMFNATISVFNQAYLSITAWLASTNRLRDLSWALNKAQHRPQDIVVQAGAANGGLQTSALKIFTPMGQELAALEPLHFAPGERWLVSGPSGTGKSTLLRAIAGLWPFGAGQVRMPEGASMMFLPQRSYIPTGALKAALAYPSDPEHFGDAQCLAALEAVGLKDRLPSLTEHERWQQKLSGGEQQRLAIARALLHKPEYLFLDEATSALDEPSERRVYEAILTQLPASAIVSIAHRPTLRQYHNHVLELQPSQSRALA